MPKRPIKSDDLLRIVFVGDPQINPAGVEILFSRKHINEKNKYITNLWSVSLDGKTRQWTSGEGESHGRWSADGSRIAFITGREKPAAQIFTMRTDGGEARKLTSLPEGSIGGFKWSPDGKWIAFLFRETHPDWTEKAKKEREEKGLSTPPRMMDDIWYRLDGDGYFMGQRYALYLVDTETGEHRPLYDKGTLDQYSYDWSPDSKSIAVAHSVAKRPLADLADCRLFLVDLAGKAKEIKGPSQGEKSAVACSPDGKWIAYAGFEESAGGWDARNVQLFIAPAEGGKARCLTDKEDYCLAALTLGDTKEASYDSVVVWAEDSKSIFTEIGWHGAVHLAEIGIDGGKVKFLTDGNLHVSVGNVAKGKIALTTGNVVKLPEIAVFEKGKVKVLSKFNDAFHDEIAASEPEELWLDTPDGSKVHAWVMKPIGYKAPKKYAAVLQVHGGPHGQYGWTFFHEMQVLAAQGYVVVFSNPRGSKGYGEDYAQAIKGDWGNKDWIDIQTVTHWMQHQPYIDAGRLAIMGGSYGGYMTNWAVGHCNDFKCAITDRCVSNMVSMSGSSDFPNQPDTYWKGRPWGGLDEIADLWRQSPLAYFDKVKTPMLIIHSEGDLRCNVEQGEQVFTALQQQGIESRFVRYPQSTFHGLSRSGPPDLRLHRLGENLAWLEKFLK